MTQAEKIIEFIRNNGSITPIEAAHHLWIVDLARTISYMRLHQGYTNIVGEWEEKTSPFGYKVRFKRYSLKED